jgi:hypothetical protein
LNEQSADARVGLTGTAGAHPGNLERSKRELVLLMIAWLLLAILAAGLAKQNLKVPGLYYDEAVFAGTAKDFVTGQVHGQHMSDFQAVAFLGRPLPLFIQTYLGALKSWFLIPVFQLFGPTVPALRATNLAIGSVALLFFILAVRCWFGLQTALVAGALLALDPTYFFLNVLDWGAAGPSFVCRCDCFYFVLLWYRNPEAKHAFCAGLFAGLGFFNKADFALVLIGAGVAGLCCYGRSALAALRQSKSLALGSLGFLLGAGPMLFKVPRMIMLTTSVPHPNASGQLGVKLHTALAMYDGSYFYRLMYAGGVFEGLFPQPHSLGTGLGLALIVSAFGFFLLRTRSNEQGKRRAIAFLILATVFVTVGIILLPDAVRLHHSALVVPLPHLIIAAVAFALFEQAKNLRHLSRLFRSVVLLGLLAVFASEFVATLRTERLIRETGGRGRWSESFDVFCRENRNRSDLTIVSLDWGFNEQLIFLTDGPRLTEPFWNFGQTPPILPPDPNTIYLVHPPEYSAFRYDSIYLNAAERSGQAAEIQPFLDRQGQVAFYAIRFPPR